ncbi:hypothetical protein PRIPAC_80037 [Pristionchus pacificus]|uniref:NAD(P)H-hydrate epimerase n=1 Tax=Pristionchus pacificus TaxID=54126 RepID=A0A2A6CQH7_PRIPA|nr:hypothetical protein PRIPAC_80037 [Pristionchus pacificus]|eukprot:PDM80399.1 hypothetical protein PRIPAC_32978 [Pristionchus pacificus]
MFAALNATRQLRATSVFLAELVETSVSSTKIKKITELSYFEYHGSDARVWKFHGIGDGDVIKDLKHTNEMLDIKKQGGKLATAAVNIEDRKRIITSLDKTPEGQRVKGRGQGRETRVDQKSEVNKEKDGKIYLQARPKTDFDVTSSGANEATMGKMSLPIVISTLENPKTQSFRELTFLNCARLFRICPILSQTASYEAPMLINLKLLC